MKVVLIKDVSKIGNKFDIKNVADGYALNFLIPRGFAEIATENVIKKIELLKEKSEVQRSIQEDLILKNVKDLEGLNLIAKSKANDKGHLFAGIHKEELASLIKEQTQLDILPEFINLLKPLKEIGEHEIEVKVRDTTVKFKINITTE